MFVDTHCHLTMMKNENIIESAQEADVSKIITVATTLQDTISSIEIAKKNNGVYATAGIHPCDASQENWNDDFEKIKSLVKDRVQNKIIGIGETGLDFYHKPFFKQLQQDVFTAHIKLAIEHDLPLVVHIRESAEDVLSMLEHYTGKVRGVAHCFSQDKRVAQRLLALGFYLGIGGPITYPKNDDLREVIKNVPLEFLVLETDAPFLPPQQFRGKKNHPKYIPLIAQMIAEIKDVDIEQVGTVTTGNVKKLFGI